MNAILQGFMWGLGMLGADRVISSGVVQAKAKKFWDDVMYVADGKDKKPMPAIRGEVVDFATGQTLKKGVVQGGGQ